MLIYFVLHFSCTLKVKNTHILFWNCNLKLDRGKEKKKSSSKYFLLFHMTVSFYLLVSFVKAI